MQGPCVSYDTACSAALVATHGAHIYICICICMYMYTGSSHSVASGRLSFALGMQGPCVSYDTACSAALVSTHGARVCVCVYICVYISICMHTHIYIYIYI